MRSRSILNSNSTNPKSPPRRASEAALAMQAALLRLNQLRGLAPDARLSVAQTGFSLRPAENLETLVALARTNNFEIRQRAVELAQQGFRVELQKQYLEAVE